MIFSAFQRDDPDWMLTTIQRNGHYFKVGMTAEELFKAALGEEEWNRRVAEAYHEQTGQHLGPPPPPPVPPKVPDPEPKQDRFINVKSMEERWSQMDS
jgi:hypothetical protein